jgi:hypothetical protein
MTIRKQLNCQESITSITVNANMIRSWPLLAILAFSLLLWGAAAQDDVEEGVATSAVSIRVRDKCYTSTRPFRNIGAVSSAMMFRSCW